MSTGRRERWLGTMLVALGAGIAAAAILGPLVLDIVVYRTLDTTRHQIVGGDLAVLVAVPPTYVAAGAMALRGHRAAPVVALTPAVFALYTCAQLIVGNEYLRLPGNVEAFFPLLLGIFVAAGAVAVGAWNAAQYVSSPTPFWLVKLMDPGIVVPAAVAVVVGLLRHRPWARKPMHAILGAYTLLAASVTGMAAVMWLTGDPDASTATLVGAAGMTLALAAFCVRLYAPLFRRPATPAAPRPAVLSARR
jgi:hypothetical protein